jgi:quinol monooxygenase YgiN
MITKGLLVRLEVKSGLDEQVENFLTSALPLVQQEPATTAWFAIRFGHSEYGIFDVFPDDAGRDAHLSGAVAKALMENAPTLLSAPPKIQKLDILAYKLPEAPLAQPNTKGLVLTFEAKEGHQQQVEQFLRDARALVMEEPDTTAWFAIHTDDDKYGIFDVFPDHGGRVKHLVGHVPRELAKHALSLLGSLPDPDLLDVLAEDLRQET